MASIPGQDDDDPAALQTGSGPESTSGIGTGSSEMDARHRKRLIRHRQLIVDDLEVKVVLDYLVEREVFDYEAQQLIEAQTTSHDKARKLLDLLPSRGPKAFGHFVDSMRDDYDWLVEELEQDDDDGGGGGKDELDASLEDPLQTLNTILLRGGVPHEPSHNVTRHQVLKKLRLGLSELQPGQFLVIHGMPGSGKSVLAAEAVRDQDITLQYFPDGVFWFRVGMIERDVLFNRLKILCEKVEAPYMPTDIEHAQYLLNRMFLPDKLGQSLIILDDVWTADVIKAFTFSARVLVTTRDSSVMDVVSESHRTTVSLNQGFDEQESLELFSQFVSVEPVYLPAEARLIHAECKGSPMVISMIGSLISETAGAHPKKQSGRWSYYLYNLKSRRYSKLRKQRSYQHNSVMEAVMLSVDNLDGQLKDRYQELAVFLDDVGVPTKGGGSNGSNGSNGTRDRWSFSHDSPASPQFGPHGGRRIRVGGFYDPRVPAKRRTFAQLNYGGGLFLPVQVLMTYWDMDQYEVEDVMTRLLEKAMAESVWDDKLESYVYTVHDLQLDYLKAKLKDGDGEKDLHRHFLQCYLNQAPNSQYGQIEDDSYIFSYFGHHLYKSEQYHLFPEIYLDLSFVEAMLKATNGGPVNLLNDYKKYGTHIMGVDETHFDKLVDYETFARTVGAVVSTHPNTDIIQLALREPEDSAVYRDAKQLASERPDKLYFEWLNRSQLPSPHSATILHHGVALAASFLADLTKILTSNGDGQIKVWDVQSGEVLHRFTGHKSSVKTLELSPGGDLFASGSEDGAVKVWDLGRFLDSEDGDGLEEQRETLRKVSIQRRPSSLHLKRSGSRQSVNSLLTYDHELRDLSNQSFRFNDLHHEIVLCVAFSPDGEEIVAGGQSGLVKVFNLRARGLRLKIDGHKEPTNVCRFSQNGRLICTGSDDASVRLWNSETGEFEASNSCHGLRVIDAVFVQDKNQVISMSADKIIKWSFPSSEPDVKKRFRRRQARFELNLVEFKRAKKVDFNCMALSNDSRRLVAASVDHMITVWDVETAQVAGNLPGHSDHIYALHLTHDDSFLVSGSADETLMIWSMERYDDNEDDDADADDDLRKDASASKVCADKDADASQGDFALRPCFDAKFVADAGGVARSRMVAADDENCIQFLEDGVPKARLPADTSDICCVALSSDGHTAAYGCRSGSVRLVRPAYGMVKTLGTHEGEVNDVKISADGVTVVSAGADGVVTIFHDGGRTFECRPRGRQPSLPPALELLLLEDLLLARYQDGSVRQWDAKNGKRLRVYDCADNGCASTFMDASARAGLLALALASGKVSLIDLKTLQLARTLEEGGGGGDKAPGPVRVCRFSPDGRLLAVGFDTGVVQAWGDNVSASSSSSKSSSYCSLVNRKGSGTSCVIQIWDAKVGTKLYQPFHLHQSWVNDIHFGPDNLTMVTVGDKVAWWSLHTVSSLRKASTASGTSLSAMAGPEGTAGDGGGTAEGTGKGATTATAQRGRKTSRTALFRRKRQSSESRLSESEGGVMADAFATSPGSTGPKRSSRFDPDTIVKVGSANCRELLQMFDVRGSALSKIVASADFKKFVTLDDAGIVYVLEEIQQQQANNLFEF